MNTVFLITALIGVGFIVLNLIPKKLPTDKDEALKKDIKDLSDKKLATQEEIDVINKEISGNKLEVKKPSEVEEYWNKK